MSNLRPSKHWQGLANDELIDVWTDVRHELPQSYDDLNIEQQRTMLRAWKTIKPLVCANSTVENITSLLSFMGLSVAQPDELVAQPGENLVAKPGEMSNLRASQYRKALESDELFDAWTDIRHELPQSYNDLEIEQQRNLLRGWSTIKPIVRASSSVEIITALLSIMASGPAQSAVGVDEAIARPPSKPTSENSAVEQDVDIPKPALNTAKPELSSNRVHPYPRAVSHPVRTRMPHLRGNAVLTPLKIPNPPTTFDLTGVEDVYKCKLFPGRYGGAIFIDLGLCKYTFDTRRMCPLGSTCQWRHSPLKLPEQKWIAERAGHTTVDLMMGLRRNPDPAVHPTQWVEG